MYKNIQLPSTKSLISTAASITATAMLIRSLSRDLIPQQLTQYFFNKLNFFLTKFTYETTVIIDEYEGLNKNHLFIASEIYLSTLITTPSTKTLRASLPEKEKKIQISIGGNEELSDNFCGIQLKWRMIHEKSQSRYVPYNDYHSTVKSEVRYLVLTFHKKNRVRVVDEYLPYVLEKSKSLKEEKKTLKLHTLKNERVHVVGGPGVNPWQSVNLDHPAKFETLAMDDEIKKAIIDDLDRFLERKEFYRRVGKAWKRGYLLFGPPGTGKSSLIAAMANYLNFDVYDLELTDLRYNSELRRLVISTANRSILVVEDIDASIDFSERGKKAQKPPPISMHPSYDQGPKVTLSGLLNFIDGLWSSCGDERIIIFTTNHKEKLDPALLRPGRMDVHIHMSYCTPCGFKMLVSNYLQITDHPLAIEAERLVATTKVTPAEIGEQLLKGDDPELVLRGLIEFLERKKESELAKQESVEVSEEEILVNVEQNEGNGTEGLKELIKMSNASSSEKILKKGEAAKALRILIQFLEGEIGTELNVKDSGISLESSEIVTLPESGKEEGIKTE